MNFIYANVQQVAQFLKKSFKDEQFYVALRHVIGAFIPLIIGEALGFERIGLLIMLGAFFVSGVDIAGTLRSKASGLGITTVTAIGITILLLIPNGRLWFLLPLLFIIIFALAFISPFSLRYTMMAVMGYIAIILALAFSASINSIHAILIHSLYLLIGACWYIIYALCIHYFASAREINRRVAFCMRQTADYFDQRLALLESGRKHQDELLELARLQQQLNETQESVRKLLFENPSILTNRHSKRHRFFTIFVELVDMHELAVATPIDYPRIRKLLHRYPEYGIVRKIIREVNREMHNLADVMLNEANYQAPGRQQQYLDQLHEKLQTFNQERSLDDSDEQVYDTLKRIEEYLQRQLQKADKIRDAVLDPKASEAETRDPSADVSTEDLPRFISPDPLNWNTLSANISFQSSYFRYALRTAVTAVIGYLIADYIHFQNPYWVVLTVLLVMKPGYGVTKQRFFHRIAGTIIGAVIAYGIYQFHPTHTVSIIIFGLAFLFTFTFVTQNYAVASTFITLFVIFLYYFLSRQVPTAILFRVVDTVLGAVLVILAIFYLWPYWEHQKFSYFLNNSLQANKRYLQQVLSNLFDETFDETDYRLVRKQAYVDMANVISSFYRFKDDPASRQKHASSFYDLVLLNYMLLSATTSLAIFLQRHPDQSLSYAPLRKLGDKAIANLEHALSQLKAPAASHEQSPETSAAEEAGQIDEEIGQELTHLRAQFDPRKEDENDERYAEYVNLNHLGRQLKWMFDLSQSIIDHVHQTTEIHNS